MTRSERSNGEVPRRGPVRRVEELLLERRAHDPRSLVAPQEVLTVDRLHGFADDRLRLGIAEVADRTGAELLVVGSEEVAS